MLNLSLLLALTVTVANPTADSRQNVPVTVAVGRDGKEVNSVRFRGNPEIKWQLDDLNDDGRADELAFLVDLKPNQTRTLTIDLSSAKSDDTVAPQTAAFIRLNDKNKKHPPIQAIAFPGTADNRQMYNSLYGHGAMLEGLNSAIRVYLDNRQSVDLYLKHTPRLELSETCFYTTAEQLGAGYGRDVLWAGTSVALGSFRGLQNGQPVTIDTVVTRSQRVLTSGPVRSIIEVSDRGWTYNGHPVEMRQRYTTWAGRRDYDVDITLKGAASTDRFATGVQKLAIDNSGFITPDGLAGSWGSNVPDKNMKELADTIGLGVFIPEANLVKVNEDELNYLAVLKPDSKGRISYSFTATGLRDTDAAATDPQQWFEWLRAWGREKRSPVRVTVK